MATELRDIIPELTKSQIELLKMLDALREELESNPRFCANLKAALEKHKHPLSVRATITNKEIARAVKLLHRGTPEVNANVNRVFENAVMYLILSALEEKKDGD